MRARRSIPIRPILACLLATALVAAGCTSEEVPDAGRGKGAPVGAGDRYVAIGDSYTAAYLTGPTDTSSGGCLRSLANYPHLVAEELDLDLTDVSCGGASTEAVEGGFTALDGSRIDPQLDAIDGGVDLVTISIGANDFNTFGGIVVNCVQVAASDPDGSPCADIAERATGGDTVDRTAERIRGRVLEVIGAVVDKAPEARVVVVGYPQVFPATGSCEQLPLARGDVAFAYDVLRGVTDALESAAEEAGAEYVDVWSASAGHDICGDEPWIAGARPTRTDGTAYHPFPEEQELVGDLVVDQLRARA